MYQLGIFGAKLVINIMAVTGIAWGVSFWVADYVVKASVSGMAISVQNLQASLDTLSATVRQVDQDIKIEVRHFNEDRNALARDIAKEIAAVQAKNGEQSAEIRAVASSLARIEQSLEKIQGTLRINFTGDGKGWIGVNQWNVIRSQYGVDDNTPILVVPTEKNDAPPKE